jgi:hypothetical protein
MEVLMPGDKVVQLLFQNAQASLKNMALQAKRPLMTPLFEMVSLISPIADDLHFFSTFPLQFSYISLSRP